MDTLLAGAGGPSISIANAQVIEARANVVEKPGEPYPQPEHILDRPAQPALGRAPLGVGPVADAVHDPPGLGSPGRRR